VSATWTWSRRFVEQDILEALGPGQTAYAGHDFLAKSDQVEGPLDRLRLSFRAEEACGAIQLGLTEA
jgi:hypothetical protein